MATKSAFATLNAINCNEHIEKKNGLSYVSWAWAWQYVKEKYPDAFYTIYENAQGWNYFTDGRTCWVKTGVTIEGLEHIEYLPVMDFRNNSIPLENVKSTDVNKTIQRSLTKACARHGLGLYVYAGEDLPIEGDPAIEEVKAPTKRGRKATAEKPAETQVIASAINSAYKPMVQESYDKFIEASANGKACASGKTAFERWIEITHAGDEQIALYKNDVVLFCNANGIEVPATI